MKLFLAFLVLLSSSALFLNGNCPGGKCRRFVCGTQRKYVNITQWCSKYNWDQKCCNCVATRESGGNINALNYNVDDTYDVGLWQINQVNWGLCNRGKPPCDPIENLKCAIVIYEQGNRTFKYWATGAGCGCS